MDKEALQPLCKRCSELSMPLSNGPEKSRLLNMINTLESNSHWPDLKVGKWLGFIEGVLISKGITTVDAERDFTRPIYHAYYKRVGIGIPPTVDVMDKLNTDH